MGAIYPISTSVVYGNKNLALTVILVRDILIKNLNYNIIVIKLKPKTENWKYFNTFFEIY